ncbi:MAG TPA: tetratricopeptide repeat protein [Blastocatellia bacterium]|nr:tetratricopeptide repeat protein [Blastocatellia bacterium]
MQFYRLIAVSVICCVAASAYQSDDALKAFEQAREFFDHRDWDQAERAAAKAIAIDPHLGDAEILLGLVATVQSRFNEAETHFFKAVALEPENYQAHAYLGSTYLEQKKLSEAVRSFEKVLELNPGNVAANYNLGLIALEQGAPADALVRFQTTLRSSPVDVPALTGLLTSQLMLNRVEDARHTTEQLQRLLEDRDPRLLQVAAILAEHGDPAAAIPVMERLRKAFPQSWDINYNLAVACFRTAQYERAVEILQPFTGPEGRAEASDMLGAIEEKRGHIPEAERAFAEAVAREPSNEDYRFDYGNSLAQHNKVQSAVTVFRTAVGEMPRSWRLRIGLGSGYYLAGEYENAAQTLLDAVRLKPDSVVGWFLLGEAYESAPLSERKIETAFASYLQTAPRDAWAYYHYGAILYLRAQAEGRRDYQEAVSNLNQALHLNPNLAEAHLELGLIAQAEGKTEQSITAFERAINLEPELVTAHYRLALAYKRIGKQDRAQEELSRFRALKEDEGQRARVLKSLATISASEGASAEQP